MLICTVFIAINWARRTSPPSQSTEPLLDSYGSRCCSSSAAASPRSSAEPHHLDVWRHVRVPHLLSEVPRTPYLGADHDDRHACADRFFFFFEALMRITLPKGWKFTEPLFNWLNNIIY
jgi:putative tricarboxylic transport membrane protein